LTEEERPVIMLQEKTMLTEQRKRLILERLATEGRIVAKELSLEFGLSEDTIRRDLRELSGEGRLQRVHGGALPSSPALADFAGRERISSGIKDAIGRAAAALVQDGQVVFIDGGTSTARMVRAFRPELRATVVTHSPSVAMELVPFPNIEVVLLGGRLFRHSIVAVGAATVEAIAGIRADLFFLGATGIHPEAGVTTGDFEEAAVKRAFCAAAAETILLASTEKLGAVSPYLIVPIAAIATLVVERTLDGVTAERFRAAGPDLVFAD
jgi:DeoR/GlpR family transcriptional regulator of sugar metabolism